MRITSLPMWNMGTAAPAPRPRIPISDPHMTPVRMKPMASSVTGFLMKSKSEVRKNGSFCFSYGFLDHRS